MVVFVMFMLPAGCDAAWWLGNDDRGSIPVMECLSFIYLFVYW